MKANELMIGDWVYSTFSKLPCKVTYLKLHESGYGSVKTTNVIGVKDIASLSPIPLTSEILEKNGFKYKEGETGMYGVTTAPHYICDDVPFEVFCDGEPFAIWFEEPVDIKYVYQLQHALRLCEIEKEIIL